MQIFQFTGHYVTWHHEILLCFYLIPKPVLECCACNLFWPPTCTFKMVCYTQTRNMARENSVVKLTIWTQNLHSKYHTSYSEHIFHTVRQCTKLNLSNNIHSNSSNYLWQNEILSCKKMVQYINCIQQHLLTN
jgi:hypothetical protein